MINYNCRPTLACWKNYFSCSVIGLLLSLTTSGVSLAEQDALPTENKTDLSFLYAGNRYDVTLFAPPNKNSDIAYPLLIVASSVGDRLSRFIRATDFSRLASRNSAVVAYIQIDQHDDWFNAIGLVGQSGNPGAEFFRSIITRVSSSANILADKIYLTGYSAGGVLVLTAMCEMAKEVAAFAAVSASLPESWKSKCSIKRSVPAIIFASRDDPVVPWNGGKITIPLSAGKTLDALSVSDSIDLWRVNNKCDPRPLLEPFANVDPSDGTTVTRLTYDYGCNNAAPVYLYAITGAGHAWPGSSVKLRSFEGAISRDINASNVIWEFLRKYSLKR